MTEIVIDTVRDRLAKQAVDCGMERCFAEVWLTAAGPETVVTWTLPINAHISAMERIALETNLC